MPESVTAPLPSASLRPAPLRPGPLRLGPLGPVHVRSAHVRLASSGSPLDLAWMLTVHARRKTLAVVKTLLDRGEAVTEPSVLIGELPVPARQPGIVLPPVDAELPCRVHRGDEQP